MALLALFPILFFLAAVVAIGAFVISEQRQAALHRVEDTSQTRTA